MAKREIVVEMFADIICPWCLIGERRLAEAAKTHGGVDLKLRWRVFLLNPNMPPEGMDRQDYINRKFGVSGEAVYERIASVGSEAGIDFAFDKIKRTPDSRLAHALILSAGEHQEKVIDKIFQAYFIKGIDIDEAFLTDLAKRYEVTFPPPKSAIEQIDADLSDAVRLGIEGVPFFIFPGEFALSGAHPPQTFLPLFDAALNR